MEQKELEILQIVADNSFTSQRKIARQTGISLGQVNFLIQKFINKGLLKMEGQTSSTLRYHLTPKGIADIADRTLRYVKASYAMIQQTSLRIKEVGKKYTEKNHTIYLVGSQDEMMEISQLALNDAQIPYHVSVPEEGDEKAVIFCWEQEMEERYAKFKCVNLFKLQK